MTDEPKLITLTTSGSATLELYCDAIATDGFSVVLASVAGPQMAITAVAAGLRNSGSMMFKPSLRRLFGEYAYAGGQLHAKGTGYEMFKTALDYDLWHLVAVARWENLLVRDTTEALWDKLKGPQFTTPMLEHWTPEIEKQLRVENFHAGRPALLRKLRSFGCDAAQLNVNDDQLDRIISDAVRQGKVQIQSQ